MYANYHTHTARCHHAVGEDREYVEKAIEAGIQILGFSDHTPYIFDGDYYSTFRMRPEEAEGYVNSVLQLREEYKKDIQIYLGFETEYYPKYFERLLRFYEQFPVDYIILGQHMLGNEIGEFYTAHETQDLQLLSRYTDQVIEAIRTGKFSYVAHPDVLGYVGDPEQYRRAARRIFLAAKEAGIPVEINLLGMRTNRLYPREFIMEEAAKVGCDIILGTDAHKPEDVYDPESERKAMEWVEKWGLKLVPELKRIPPVL